MEWFNLYLHLRVTHNIQEEDTYNIDEKSNALKATSTVKVITNVENKATFRTTTSNREWVSMAECISGDGEKGPLFVMFKGQQIKLAWTELLNTVYDKASKWGGIEMTGKGGTTNEVVFVG